MTSIAIKMKVRNHPGVMSHIAGLFSRRAVNIEEIIVRPGDNPAYSTMHILIFETARTHTIIKQLAAHYDVLEIDVNEFSGDSFFSECIAEAF